MSSGQQNMGQGQNMKGNDGGNRQGMQQDPSNQARMGMSGGMPGGMQPHQMGFPPNMMNYGVPNFMQHLTGMGPMGGQMMQGMYPGAQNMMGQDMNMKGMMPQNMPMGQDKFASMGRQDSMKNQDNSKDRGSKIDEGKDQSRLQGEAKNSHLEKRDFRNDQENDDEEEEQDSKNVSQNKKIDKNQSSRRDESEPSKVDSKNVPDDEDDEGKYNLRKRTRKENPYYYCELSDEDKPEGGNRKRMKKYEDDYDPNDETPSNQKYQANKQQNMQNMQNMNMAGGMDQNAMNNQMMMQQMANRSQQMMNMPNLNDSAGALNQMMNGFNQNPMGQQNYMQKQQIPQKAESCGGGKQEGQGGMCPHCNKPKPPPELLAQILSLQNNRTAQMMQGMDYQQPYMMGTGGFGSLGAIGNMAGMGTQASTANNQTSNSRTGTYQEQNNQFDMAAAAQGANNNQDGVDSNAYQMMNRGNMMGMGGMGFSGQGFPPNEFVQHRCSLFPPNQNFSAQNFQGQSFPQGMDMSRMGQYGSFPGGMGGMPHGQQENQTPQADANTRNAGMMDMNQMQNMQGYGYQQTGNPMMNFQNMTPEQQMQMMQFRGMQGGNMPGNQMYPGNQK